MGRPSKLTEENLTKLKQALSIGATIKMACAFSKVGYSTFFYWKSLAAKAAKKQEEKKRLTKQDKILLEFLEDIKTAEVQGAIKSLARLQKQAEEGKDWKIDAWLLERRWNFTKSNSVVVEQQAITDLDPKKELLRNLSKLKLASERALAVGSFQAFAALQKRQVDCILEIKNIEREQVNEIEDLTDEALLEQISAFMQALPPILRQQLMRELNPDDNVIPFKRK